MPGVAPTGTRAPLLLRPPRRCDVRRCRRVVAGHVPAARPRSKRVVHTFSFVFVHAQPAVRALAVLGAAAVDAAPPALHALGDTLGDAVVGNALDEALGDALSATLGDVLGDVRIRSEFVTGR